MPNVREGVFHLLSSKELFEKIMITIIHVSLQKTDSIFSSVENNIRHYKDLLPERKCVREREKESERERERERLSFNSFVPFYCKAG